MPTPRTHGGAALAHIPLMVPGFMGLNKQQSSGTLGPEWATVLENAVIDDNGRLAARKGWSNNTTTSIASPFAHVAEFVKSNGDTELVGLTASGLLYRSLDGGSVWTAPAGTYTVSDAQNAIFQNFNNKLWLFSEGQKPISYDGTTCAQVSDVNAPTKGIGLAAFGRLWGVANDGHTLRYSALLDGTDWTSADNAGLADHWNVWPGNDQITAVAAFNGSLVVFGKRAVVMWTDGQGSALGLDPLRMYVVDVIQGTGTLSQHSIQHIDGDMWFVSEFGLQSLGRLIQEKSNPLANLTKNVQDFFSASVTAANLSLLRSVYSQKDRLYLLSLPSGGSSESGRCFAFDTRGRLEDNSVRSLGTWTLVPTAPVCRRNGALMFQIARPTAKVGTYTGGLDDGAAFIFNYESGWLDLTKEGFLLFPKRYGGVFFSDNAIDITFKWALDFALVFKSKTKQFTGEAGGGEWGSGEWGLSEFGGGVNLREGNVLGNGSGEYIKLGITAQISNTVLAVQQLDLFAKIGRYA